METVEAADREAITARALHSLFLADSFIMKSNHFWLCLGLLLVHFAMISAHCKRTLAGRRSNNVGDVYSNCKLRSSKDSWWTDEDTNHALVDSRRDCCVCVCESTGCELGQITCTPWGSTWSAAVSWCCDDSVVLHAMNSSDWLDAVCFNWCIYILLYLYTQWGWFMHVRVGSTCCLLLPLLALN